MSTSTATRRSTSTGPRIAAVVVVLVLLLVLAAGASLAFGAKAFSAQEVIDALRHPDATTDAAAVVSSRIPRTVNGLLVGAALALAGSLMQSATRNPLAEPGLLGISGGSALAVVIGIGAFGVAGVGSLSWFALVGAAVAALLVQGIAQRGPGGASPLRLALAGAALAAGMASVTQAILLRSQEQLDAFRFWQVGSLAVREPSQVILPALLMAVGLLLALLVAPGLDRLGLGDDVAASLGTHPSRVRLTAIAAAVLLSGAATTVAGPVVFVGLVVPHVLRLVVGSRQRVLVPLCLLGGPVLVLAADTLGRVVAPPGEVPVGVMTALVGAPVFLILLRMRGRA